MIRTRLPTSVALYAAVVVVFWTANLLAGPPDPPSLSDLVRRVMPSVFLVGNENVGKGSAFVISQQHRLLATNAHVADLLRKSGSMLAVQNESSHFFKIDKVWYHPGVVRQRADGAKVRSQSPSDDAVYPYSPDVAVLHVAGDDELPPAFTCASPEELDRVFAERICMLGFPGHDTTAWPKPGEEAKASFREGYVAHVTDFQRNGNADKRDLQFVQCDIKSWFGFSGSPILLSNGHVAAVQNSITKVEQNGMTASLTHGIRIDCLWELLVFHGLDGKVSVPISKADLRLERFEGQTAHAAKEGPALAVAPFDATAACEFQEQWARHLGLPVQMTNSIGMKLTLMPLGEFLMGSSKSAEEIARRFNAEAKYYGDAQPQHRVRITKPFYLQTTEVTQSQWESVMETKPWRGKKYVKEGSEYPATYVSWEDAHQFCQRLSGKDGTTYRLPTEAEWEYACRAGTTTMFHFGDDASRLGEYAWFHANAVDAGEGYARQVGLKRANAFGLYDMSGNLWEWCQDWYGKDYYSESPSSDPAGPSSGSHRVFRGGGWGIHPEACGSAHRNLGLPGSQPIGAGFRVARGLPSE